MALLGSGLEGGPRKHFLLWMDVILHHLKTMGNHGRPLFIGIYRGFIIPGILRWCEMDFVHSMNPREAIRLFSPRRGSSRALELRESGGPASGWRVAG